MTPATSLRAVAPVDLLAEGLDGLVRELAAIPGVDAELVDRARRLGALASGMEGYLRRSTSPESPALAALGADTRAHAWGHGLEAEMLSGHVEGQLLAFLTRATGARRVLEIGLFTGYSALAIAEALPPEGRLLALEVDEGAAALARTMVDRSPAGARIAIEVGPASETLGRLAAAGASYDLVFIDADKGGYVGYLDALLDTGLLADDGLICVDNTLMQGEPWLDGPRSSNGDAIALFNEIVSADERVRQVVLPVRDGLTLIQRA